MSEPVRFVPQQQEFTDEPCFLLVDFLHWESGQMLEALFAQKRVYEHKLRMIVPA